MNLARVVDRMLWLAGLAMVGWAGCGSGPRVHRVEIRDLVFEPSRLAVAAGDTVLWVNHDVVPHTVTFATPGAESDEVAAGATLRVIVPAGDTLAYRCRYHPMMTAYLVVR